MSEQACNDVDPELFFGPGDGADGVAPMPWEQRALAVCGGCAVVKPCLEEALEHPAGQQFGVVGGRTAGQRRSMLSARAAVDRARRATEQAREAESSVSRAVPVEDFSVVRHADVVGVSR